MDARCSLGGQESRNNGLIHLAYVRDSGSAECECVFLGPAATFSAAGASSFMQNTFPRAIHFLHSPSECVCMCERERGGGSTLFN
jgi:hypothetical protein